MKRIVSILFAALMLASLSFGVCATELRPNATPNSAQTAVSFTVDPAYIVTIPETITLVRTETEGVVTYENNLTVEADAGLRLLENTALKVYLTGDFEMTAAAGSRLPYTVSVDNTRIEDDDVVATFVTDQNAQTETLHVEAGDPTYAGEYTDTVTFTLAVEALAE